MKTLHSKTMKTVSPSQRLEKLGFVKEESNRFKHSDGRLVVSTCSGHGYTLWNLFTPECRHSVAHSRSLNTLVCSLEDQYMRLSGV